MSKRELGRVEVLARVRSKQLRGLDAGRLLRVSYRQAKRLWKRYREEGAAGLKHRSAGGSSNRAHDEKFRQQVLRRGGGKDGGGGGGGLGAEPGGAALAGGGSNRAHDEKFRQQVLRRVREKYGGAVGERFGPTLAAEHLASEDGLQVHAETLRRWMLTEGLWSRERKRRRHLLRRERKEHFGEMVQMDGSFHAWLEERGPQGCLIDLVDDATSTTWARLGEQETIWAVVDALRAWIERYGVPQSVYVDWKNVYKRAATVKEQLRGEEPVTQFGRMCAKLGIAVIAASSPQGKGRVERQHGTHQDRLVKKLRRVGIADATAANAFLETTYLPEHNVRFAQAPASTDDFHRRTPGRITLDRVLQLEETRVLSNDWVIRYDTRYFQVARQSHQAPARSTVLVRENADGAIEIRYRERLMRRTESAAPGEATP